MTRQLIVTADDFGISAAVNAAVEAAHQGGILSTASLMVGAPAAADAVARARRLPGLKVGLHLVLVDGASLLDGRPLDDNQIRAGFRYFFSPAARRRLAAEIRAQFEAFRATGLALDHVNAHKHMHVHPTVARLVVAIGGEYGMRAVRVPTEPAAVLRAAAPGERHHAPAWLPAVAALRRRLTGAGLARNDHLFGIAWSGAMNEARVLALLPQLPDGLSEVYFHPDGANADFAALTSPRVRQKIAELRISLTSYAELAPGRVAPAG